MAPLLVLLASLAAGFGFELNFLLMAGLRDQDLRVVYQAFMRAVAWEGLTKGVEMEEEVFFAHNKIRGDHVQLTVEGSDGETEVPDVENLPNKIDMQEDERLAVERWHKFLRKEDLSGSVLISGSGGGMLGSKLAYEEGGKSVVVVMRSNDRMHSKRHIALNEFLGVENLIICEGELDPRAASAVLDAGEDNLFDRHIATTDIVSGLVFDSINPDAYKDSVGCEQRLDNFESELGRLFSLVGPEGTNYWMVPYGKETALGVQKLLDGECKAEVSVRLGEGLEGALALVARVYERSVRGGKGKLRQAQAMEVEKGGAMIKIGPRTPGKRMDREARVSLHNLLWLGVEKRHHRKSLARELLRGGGRLETKGITAAAPWNIFFDGTGSGRKGGDDVIWKSIKEEIASDSRGDEEEFSFMEIGGAGVGALVAKEYGTATVVSVLSDESEAATIVDEIVREERWNHAVCTKETVGEVAKNLYESPELMRYSYWDGLAVFMGEVRREEFGRTLGGLFTSALTSFVAVPSDAEWSLVWNLLGTDVIAPYGGAYKQVDWKLESHPRGKFEGFNKKFLSMETEVKGGDTKVVISATEGSSLVRVDVLNATRAVHHHYDFKKDGHKRTYTMHISTEEKVMNDDKDESMERDEKQVAASHFSNGRWAKVWLTRDFDGHFIPYNEIKSLTVRVVPTWGDGGGDR